MSKVSVIMPVYNAENYLKEAMDSILRQTYKNFEFIIINDSSTDSTEKIIHSFADKRIKYYKNHRNLGVAKTLNKGIKLASGEYIARMDSDDISLARRIEKQVEFMNQHPEVVVLGTGIEVFGDNLSSYNRSFSTESEKIKLDLLFASAFAHPSVMIRKRIIDQESYYYNFEYEGIEDYELWWRIIKRYEIATIKDCLLKYRVHDFQVTKSYTDIYKKRLRKLKNKQLEDFGYKPCTQYFELYMSYCLNDMVINVRNVKSLLEFLLDCQRSNVNKQFYDEELLYSYFSNIAFKLISSKKIKGIDSLHMINEYQNKFFFSFQMKIKLVSKLIIRKIKTIKKLTLSNIIKLNNKNKLKNRKFTIISNNCWGGFVYQKYGLRYLTPTVGLLIFGEDYVKFCSDLRYYSNQDLRFIPFESAKYFSLVKGEKAYPVALLDDVEIHFMHYDSEKEAREKWKRRCRRIEWNRIIYKISERKGFSEDVINDFINTSIEKKLVFTSSHFEKAIYVPGLKNIDGDETAYISKYFNELEYLNNTMNEETYDEY